MNFNEVFSKVYKEPFLSEAPDQEVIDPNNEFDNLTIIFEGISKVIESKLTKTNMDRIVAEIMSFIDKNDSVLNTNIIGKQLYFNSVMQDLLPDILGFKSEEIKKIITNDPYYNKLLAKSRSGNIYMTDQYVFGFPILVAINKLMNKNGENYAKLLFLYIYFKSYASLCYKYFRGFLKDRYEQQMLYTIEHLSNKYDIKKYGNIINFLISTSGVAFDNYKTTFEQEHLTDRQLVDIYNSGVVARLEQKIIKIKGEFQNNKGKYYSYEEEDRGSGSEEYGDLHYNLVDNVSLRKSNVVEKTIQRMLTSPLDETDMKAAGKICGNVSQTALRVTLDSIIHDQYKTLPELLDAMLSAYVVEGAGDLTDLKTVRFVQKLMDVYKTSRTNSVNVLKTKALISELLEKTSNYYIASGKTQRDNIKRAVYWYFIKALQK